MSAMLREPGLLIELAEANERIRQLEYDKKIYLARAEASEADYARVVGRNRQLEAERVPDEARELLDDIILSMEEGFVRCENCGEQEDTKDLDFMSDLVELRAMLAAAPAQEKV